MTKTRSLYPNAAAKFPWLALPFLAALAVTWACEKPAPPPPPPPPVVKVDQPRLGISIGALPASLKVESTSGVTVVLVNADPTREGRMEIESGPVEKGGVNLVAAVKAHKESTLQKPGGEYKGQSELRLPLGTAFTSRALYDEGGRRIEEIAVFMIHPMQNSELRIWYRYPATDAKETARRMNDEVFGVVGEIGPYSDSAAPKGP